MGLLDNLGKILGVGAGIAGIPFTGGASAATLLPAILGAGGSVASALGGSQASNRTNQNAFDLNNNRALADIFGTQTGAQTNLYNTQVGAQSNLYNTQANQQTSQYNTQQQALIQALLAASNEAQANARTDLDRRKFSLDAPSTRAGQAVRGSILQNIQPSRTTGGSSRLQAHTPTVTGGAINALGPGAREAGRLLESGALAGLKSGDTFDALPTTDFQGGVMKPPGILAAPSPLAPPTPIAPPTLSTYQGPGTGETILGLLGLGGSALESVLNRNRVPITGAPGQGTDPYDWQGPPYMPDDDDQQRQG